MLNASIHSVLKHRKVGEVGMTDREKVIMGTEICLSGGLPQRCIECPYHNDGCDRQRMIDTLKLLKEHGTEEYENGFNDAMQDKQELMYEGTDGKWHKKDW